MLVSSGVGIVEKNGASFPSPTLALPQPELEALTA